MGRRAGREPWEGCPEQREQHRRRPEVRENVGHLGRIKTEAIAAWPGRGEAGGNAGPHRPPGELDFLALRSWEGKDHKKVWSVTPLLLETRPGLSPHSEPRAPATCPTHSHCPALPHSAPASLLAPASGLRAGCSLLLEPSSPASPWLPPSPLKVSVLPTFCSCLHLPRLHSPPSPCSNASVSHLFIKVIVYSVSPAERTARGGTTLSPVTRVHIVGAQLNGC